MPAWSPTNVRAAVRLCGRSREHVVFSAPTARFHVRQFRPGPPARFSEAKGAKNNSGRLSAPGVLNATLFAALHNVHFWHKADISRTFTECLLLTKADITGEPRHARQGRHGAVVPIALYLFCGRAYSRCGNPASEEDVQ